MALINVHARTGEKHLADAMRALARQGLSPSDVVAVRHPGALPRLTRAALESGARLVLVGGGDGSASGAANVLAGTEAVLGLLPMGTGNDFARSLGIPPRLKAAAELLTRGQVMAVDLGQLDDGTFFLNSVSMGLSGRVSRHLKPALKRRWGKLAYLFAAARTRGEPPRPFQVRLRLDGEERRFEAMQVLVGNGRFQGGGQLIAPDATVDDARLDVYALTAQRREPPAARWRRLARFAAKLYLGKHTEDPEVHHWRVRRVEVEATPAQDIWCDGEPAGHTPIRAQVRPRAMRVLVPPGGPAHP